MDLPRDGENEAGRGAFTPEEQLKLTEEDERLPWLESDEDYHEPGIDPSRIVAFALIGVLALVLIGGATWFVMNSREQGSILPDGSTIAAPAEPYKTRPGDPGGAQIAGTGDTTFERAEGIDSESQIAATDTPAPVTTPSAAPAPTPSATATQAPATSGVPVQVGAYSRREQAVDGWSTLVRRYEVLQGMKYRIVEAVVDGATVHRLQAMASDRAAADNLCRAIKNAGGDCQVKT